MRVCCKSYYRSNVKPLLQNRSYALYEYLLLDVTRNYDKIEFIYLPFVLLSQCNTYFSEFGLRRAVNVKYIVTLTKN